MALNGFLLAGCVFCEHLEGMLTVLVCHSYDKIPTQTNYGGNIHFDSEISVHHLLYPLLWAYDEAYIQQSGSDGIELLSPGQAGRRTRDRSCPGLGTRLEHSPSELFFLFLFTTSQSYKCTMNPSRN